jgi:hypothetical protein
MSTAILYTVDKRTRRFEREELPESRIRKMKGIERIFDFMLEGHDEYLTNAAIDILDGLAVYRIIEKI